VFIFTQHRREFSTGKAKEGMIANGRRVFVVGTNITLTLLYASSSLLIPSLGGNITKFIGARHPEFIHKKHPDFGKKENPDLEWYIDRAVNGTLEATGVRAEQIDKAWIGNFAGELFSSQGHLGAAVAGSNPGLVNKPIMRVEGACASGGLAFASAVESILAGSDITLAVGAEVQTTVSARQGGEYLARASHFKRQRSLDDFVFPAMFARRIKGCLAAGLVTPRDLALLSVKAYANANKNPLAHMHFAKMSLENAENASDQNPNFLGNQELKAFLKTSDCSQVSDGGSGVILVSENGLKKLGKSMNDCIEVIGLGQAAGNLYTDSDPTLMSTTAAAACAAFQNTNLTAKDVNVAEVHDCFNIAEILMLEACGFAPKSKAVELLRNGDLEITGKHPINTVSHPASYPSLASTSLCLCLSLSLFLS
jgi:acetyl-CoA acetyltransferase